MVLDLTCFFDLGPRAVFLTSDYALRGVYNAKGYASHWHTPGAHQISPGGKGAGKPSGEFKRRLLARNYHL